MAKTTIEGWSLEKHSEFVKRVKPSRKAFTPKRTTVAKGISEALGYYKYKDSFGYNQAEMVKAMGKEDDWFKY